MSRKTFLLTAIGLMVLGFAIAGYSCWLYQRLTLAEAQGLHFRMHWFFDAVYKSAGKGAVCGLIGIIGLAMAGLGIRRMSVGHQRP